MEYFTEKDLEQIVHEALMSPDFKILEYKYERNNSPMEISMGNHYRLVVNLLYSQNNYVQNFFMKFLPTNKDHKDFMIFSDYFAKEAHFYSCMAPQMNKLLPEELQLPIPLCYFARGGNSEPESLHYCLNAEASVIVLDDLQQQGYSMPNKWIPLDLSHCHKIIRALAIFHSASVLLQHPSKLAKESFDTFSHDVKSVRETAFVADESHIANQICRASANTTASVMRKLWPHRFATDEAYSTLQETIWDSWRMVFIIALPSNKFMNVICHGDPWCGNFMFAYKRELNGRQTPLDVKLVDMQLYRFAPPATDILYFLHVCTRREFRNRHLHELLDYYNKEFVRTVSPSVSKKIKSAGSIEHTVRELKIFGLTIALYLIPIYLGSIDFNQPQTKVKNVGKTEGAHSKEMNIIEFLLSDRTEQILHDINKSTEFKDRIIEAFQEFLEFVGLWNE